MLNSQKQKVRLLAIGYEAPKSRLCCLNCQSGRVVMFGGSKKVHCGQARAYVSCGGICPTHVPAVAIARAA